MSSSDEALDPAAAASFSHATWALFTLAHLSTAGYGCVALSDALLGIVSAFSALCCCTLIVLALWRCSRGPARQRACA